jgi:hypothetical protein
VRHVTLQLMAAIEALGGNKRPREQEKPPQGGYVLVRQLGPNDPDTAKHARRQYLGPASRAQEENQQMTVDEDTQDARDNTQPNAGAPTSPGHNANQTTNDIAVKDDGGLEIINAPSEDIEQESSEGQLTGSDFT